MKKVMIALAMAAVAGVANAQMPTPDQVMTENDKNNDGFVTKEEATAGGTPLASFFDSWDANHDGKLTKEEVSAVLGGGAPPGGMPAGGMPPGGAPPAGK